jgi:hypothetical protein
LFPCLWGFIVQEFLGSSFTSEKLVGQIWITAAYGTFD